MIHKFNRRDFLQALAGAVAAVTIPTPGQSSMPISTPFDPTSPIYSGPLTDFRHFQFWQDAVIHPGQNVLMHAKMPYTFHMRALRVAYDASVKLADLKRFLGNSNESESGYTFSLLCNEKLFFQGPSYLLPWLELGGLTIMPEIVIPKDVEIKMLCDGAEPVEGLTVQTLFEGVVVMTLEERAIEDASFEEEEEEEEEEEL